MKKNITRVISCLIVLVLTISSLGIVSVSASDPGIYDGTSVSASLAGEGTEASPFLISSGADLAYFAKSPVDGAHYKLTADIYWSAYVDGAEVPTASNWTPVKFNGTFDGDGHAIAGINVVTTGPYVGFFTEAYGVIKNLTIKDSYIASTGSEAECVAAFVGVVQPVGATEENPNPEIPSLEIRNCVNYATVSADYRDVAAFVGKAFANAKTGQTKLKLVVSQCVNYGEIICAGATSYQGGIVGRAYAYGTDSGIYECANFGPITNTNASGKGCVMGGIVGSVGIDATTDQNWNFNIVDCINTADITGLRLVGGIIGRNYPVSTIKNCVNVGKITINAADKNKLQFGAISGYEKPDAAGAIVNTYYLENCAVNSAVADAASPLDPKATAKTAAEINSAAMAELLGDKWTYNETDGLTLVAFATEAENPGSGDSAMIVVCALLATVAVLGSALVVKKVVKSK